MTRAEIMKIPLEDAHYCETCSILHNCASACPNCDSGLHSFTLATVLNRPQPLAVEPVVVWARGWDLAS